ncbi:MAG TPA: hypothetical protein VEH30_15695 [Terriglobales bacterium]|nr:hypothetical protein [Terriglobales bacterium]
MTMLLVSVVGLAMLLGLFVGAGQKGQAKLHRANVASRAVTEAPIPESKQPSSESAPDSSQTENAKSVSKPVALGAAPGPLPPPTGGLVVYRNGQVIFGQRASAPSPPATKQAPSHTP